MRKDLIIFGIIISGIAFYLWFLGGSVYKSMESNLKISGFYNISNPTLIFWSTFQAISIIIVIAGIIISIIGIVIKDKYKISSSLYQQKIKNPQKRTCRKCGLMIPYEALLCPYCKKKF